MFAKKTHSAASANTGVVLHETHVTRGPASMPAAECQSVEGAPRRRAAPGSRLLKVAAGAATGRQTKRCASACIESTAPGRAGFAPVKPEGTSEVHYCKSVVSPGPAPKRSAYAHRAPSRASAQAPTPAKLRLRSATRAKGQGPLLPSTMVARERNTVRLSNQEPNPSIERTFQRPLRALWPAAHVER